MPAGFFSIDNPPCQNPGHWPVAEQGFSLISGLSVEPLLIIDNTIEMWTKNRLTKHPQPFTWGLICRCQQQYLGYSTGHQHAVMRQHSMLAAWVYEFPGSKNQQLSLELGDCRAHFSELEGKAPSTSLAFTTPQSLAVRSVPPSAGTHVRFRQRL